MDIPSLLETIKRFRWQFAIGAVLLVVVSFWGLYLVFSGQIQGERKDKQDPSITLPNQQEMRERFLDGVMVPAGLDALAPRAVVIENHPDARPLSGVSQASLVIEAPVEGSITRLLAFFAPSTTVMEVGPVRSARPYFVDFADAWNATFFHVGGSPEALEKIQAMPSFADVNEFAYSRYFWRDEGRHAPHNVYTRESLMDEAVIKKEQAAAKIDDAWHFKDKASSTERGDIKKIAVPFGGSFNVTWNFDSERGVYVRSQGANTQIDRGGANQVEADNVIVIKTEQTVLDSVGRLRIRTTGNGQAIAYRDGKRFALRWNRSAGQPIRFESTDGSEFIFNRGKTWIEVATNDSVFAGLER